MWDSSCPWLVKQRYVLLCHATSVNKQRHGCILVVMCHHHVCMHGKYFLEPLAPSSCRLPWPQAKYLSKHRGGGHVPGPGPTTPKESIRISLRRDDVGFVGILCFVFGCNCMEFFASIAVDVANLQCAVLLHQGTAAPFQRCALFKTSQPSVSVCPSLESHPPKQLTYSSQAPTRAWPLLPKASCRPLPELHQPSRVALMWQWKL